MKAHLPFTRACPSRVRAWSFQATLDVAVGAPTFQFVRNDEHPVGGPLVYFGPCAIRVGSRGVGLSVPLEPAPKYGEHTVASLAELGVDAHSLVAQVAHCETNPNAERASTACSWALSASRRSLNNSVMATARPCTAAHALPPLSVWQGTAATQWSRQYLPGYVPPLTTGVARVEPYPVPTPRPSKATLHAFQIRPRPSKAAVCEPEWRPSTSSHIYATPCDALSTPTKGVPCGDAPLPSARRSLGSCPVCLGRMVAPLRLACSHSLCSECASKCAMAGHEACPLCRHPHLLDPQKLSERRELWRVAYGSWRAGSSSGAAGELGTIVTPSSRQATSSSRVSEDGHDAHCASAGDLAVAHHGLPVWQREKPLKLACP